jgi:hypothetical protein
LNDALVNIRSHAQRHHARNGNTFATHPAMFEVVVRFRGCEATKLLSSSGSVRPRDALLGSFEEAAKRSSFRLALGPRHKMMVAVYTAAALRDLAAASEHQSTPTSITVVI